MSLVPESRKNRAASLYCRAPEKGDRVDSPFFSGYLMPPMGDNLFLSTYRFDKPLTEIYRSTLPYVLILLAVVLLITYVPFITLGPIELLLR